MNRVVIAKTMDMLECRAIILKNGTMHRKKYKRLCLSIIDLSYIQNSYCISFLTLYNKLKFVQDC